MVCVWNGVFVYGKMIGQICRVWALWRFSHSSSSVYLIRFTRAFSTLSLYHHSITFAMVYLLLVRSFILVVFIQSCLLFTFFRSIWPHDMPIIRFCLVARPPFGISFICLLVDGARAVEMCTTSFTYDIASANQWMRDGQKKNCNCVYK